MLRFGDGADHYGTDAAYLTQGLYAQADGVAVSNANPRTGTGHFRISAGAGDRLLRRVYGVDEEVAGCGYAFDLPDLPTDSTSFSLASFRDNGNLDQCSIWCTSTGQVQLRSGGKAGTILATSAPAIISGGYQHFEARVEADAVSGACEVRVNGVTVLNITGVNTVAATGLIAQVAVGAPGNTHFGFPLTVDVDDFYIWDDEGLANADFIGDRKLFLRVEDADTADADWTKSTGTQGFALIDNIPPLDGTQYITAVNPGDVSAFSLQDVPAEVVAIAGVVVLTRAFKSDAGNAKLQVSMRNGGDTLDGDEHALSQAPAWYTDIFEVDPDTDAPWSPTGYNTAEVVFERTE